RHRPDEGRHYMLKWVRTSLREPPGREGSGELRHSNSAVEGVPYLQVCHIRFNGVDINVDRRSKFCRRCWPLCGKRADRARGCRRMDSAHPDYRVQLLGDSLEVGSLNVPVIRHE